MRFAPTEKFAASFAITKASKLFPAPPGLSVSVTSCTMSEPSVFILEWNSMQPTPSPRSTSDAPEFFFTTPFDFLATVTDHTPAGTCTACQLPAAKSQYLRPEAVLGSSAYQDFCPEASSFSTFAATGLPSFFIRAAVASTPAASQSSKGPSSQLNPSRMARSISTIELEISGTRLAEYVHRSARDDHKNCPALSTFCAPPPSIPNSMRSLAPVSSIFFAISSAANFGFCRG